MVMYPCDRMHVNHRLDAGDVHDTMDPFHVSGARNIMVARDVADPVGRPVHVARCHRSTTATVMPIMMSACAGRGTGQSQRDEKRSY